MPLEVPLWVGALLGLPLVGNGERDGGLVRERGSNRVVLSQ